MFLLPLSRYDFLIIPILRKQYGTDLLTTYGSKQMSWPAIASRLKGVGESADMSTALVAVIQHVIDVDSPNLHIRNKATKVKLTTIRHCFSSSMNSFSYFKKN